MNNSDVDTLQIDLDRLGQWAVESGMKINPGQSKAVTFTRARVKDNLNYFWGDQRISEASSCKYLRLILSSCLSWADQVNYTVQKDWKALYFIMRVLEKGSSSTKRLAYMPLAPPILEYGVSCWNPYGTVR
jgi:hypothetical protein